MQSKTKKVLHVLKSQTFFGAEHVVCNIIKNMPDNYECFYMSVNGTIGARLEKEGITYIGVNQLNVTTIKKVLKEIKPDIVHAHDFTASVMCAWACNGKQKLISHIYCNPTWIQKRNIKTILFYMACKRFDKIVVVSDAIKNEYIYATKVDNKFITLGNPFSVEEIVEKSKQSEDVPACDLIYVGRFTDEKNPMLFIDVVDGVKRRKNDMFAIMVGDGVLQKECEDMIQKKKLYNNILMVGFQENPYVYLKKAKVICIPSKWEGFGLVALEAMALGVPVVCSGAGGLQSIVNDNCGAICNTENNYCDEVVRLLDNAELYRGKADGAVKIASEFDNITTYISELDMMHCIK